MSDLRISVHAGPSDRTTWLTLAQEIEDAGFHGLYVGDHPGVTWAPFVALAAAASVTERIRLGTCVLNAGLWDPVRLAVEAATLDRVSGGRVVLGVGAGHTPEEWKSTGRTFPSAAARIDRLTELLPLTRALLRGDAVTHAGRHFTLTGAVLTEPRPVQEPVPLLVGGNGISVLRFGAEHADIVGITGLARTLGDGHRHEVDWTPSALARTVDAIASAAAAVGRHPRPEALVQHVEVTDDAAAAAERLIVHTPGASIDDLLGTPFVWIGTVEEIRDRLDAHRTVHGIERYVVRAPAVPAVRLIIDDLVDA